VSDIKDTLKLVVPKMTDDLARSLGAWVDRIKVEDGVDDPVVAVNAAISSTSDLLSRSLVNLAIISRVIEGSGETSADEKRKMHVEAHELIAVASFKFLSKYFHFVDRDCGDVEKLDG
jgi:hypothetical protein